MTAQGEEIDLDKFLEEKKTFQKRALQILNEEKCLDEAVFVVAFNIPMQIINLVYDEEIGKRVPYALSVFIDSKYLTCENPQITEGNTVELSKVTLPRRRNVFELISLNDRDNFPLKFTEIFYIKLHDTGSDKDLYISCFNPSFETIGKQPSFLRYPLYLTETPDETCQFMCVSWDELRNDAMEFVTIELTYRIRHVVTNSFLGSNLNDNVPSLCGEGYQVECRPEESLDRKFSYWVICPDINTDEDLEDDFSEEL